MAEKGGETDRATGLCFRRPSAASEATGLGSRGSAAGLWSDKAKGASGRTRPSAASEATGLWSDKRPLLPNFARATKLADGSREAPPWEGGETD